MARMQIDIVAKNRFSQPLNKLNGDLNKTKTNLLNLKNILLTVAGSLVVREFGRLTNEFQNLQNRLKLVTDSTRELVFVQEELFQISRRTRGGFAETVELYQKLALQSQNLGLANSDLLEITENVNKVIGIAGVNSIQASAGILQLSQAFASGRLQGDEFRSISENIPPLLDIFAKELGVTRGELKKLGSEGKITSEIIATSLLKETDNINEKFKQISPTIGQAATRIGNSFLNLTGKFNEATGAADGLSSMLISISDTMDKLTIDTYKLSAAFEIFKGLLGIPVDIDKLRKGLRGVKGALPDARDLQKLEQFQTVAKEVFNPVPIIEYENELAQIPTATEKAIRKFEEMNTGVLDQILKKKENIADILATSINDGITTMSRSLAESLVLGNNLKDTMRNFALQVLVRITTILIEQIARQSIQIALENTQLVLLGQKLAVEKQITAEKDKQNSESNKQLKYAFLNSLTGGGGGFSGFANGGAVSKGQPVVVGERGPELFFPNQTGQITQNARGTGGGDVSVNFNINTLDASGFEDLLVRSRGTITALINNAVNERGKEALI